VNPGDTYVIIEYFYFGKKEREKCIWLNHQFLERKFGILVLKVMGLWRIRG
jgi:hypothetical protein